MQQKPPPLRDGVSVLKQFLVRLVGLLVLLKLGHMAYDYFNGEAAQLRELEDNMSAWHWGGTGALTLNEECKANKNASICAKSKGAASNFSRAARGRSKMRWPSPTNRCRTNSRRRKRTLA